MIFKIVKQCNGNITIFYTHSFEEAYHEYLGNWDIIKIYALERKQKPILIVNYAKVSHLGVKFNY